jgi:hypothetical protein
LAFDKATLDIRHGRLTCPTRRVMACRNENLFPTRKVEG